MAAEKLARAMAMVAAMLRKRMIASVCDVREDFEY
jgi:hypothetical protein